MDITKVSADILNGPNWGTWAVQIQAAARVLNCWAAIKGERILVTTPPVYNLLAKPVQGTAPGQISDEALFAKSLFEWNKMNSMALGLIQGKLNPALWPDYVDVRDATTFWTHLETKYRKAGGANTYLQFIRMIKQTFTDSADLLSQIQKFQENYQQQRSTRSTVLNVEKITTAQRITGTRPHKGKAAEEVRRKRVGSKRRKGGVLRKAKSPWLDKNR